MAFQLDNLEFPIGINSNKEKHYQGFKLTTEEVLEEIREELKEIKLLYKELVDKLVPVKEAAEEEKKAIEEKNEVADEKELMEKL
jgi:archaellum component FlaC